MQTTKPLTKPSKQRKRVFDAPDHIRYKFFAAHLSPELRAAQKVKTLSVRSGDTVRVMRGDHKGFEGKVTSIDRRNYRIYVEGLTREKVDGTTVFVPVHPSKVMITNLNLDDKWRKKIVERRREARKKLEEVEVTIKEKPPEEVAEIKEVIEEKPKAKRARKRKEEVTKKPAVKAKRKKAEEEAKEEEKPRAKKTRAKRKSVKETEGGA
jgi:large subunit ribosomal protein L24